MGATLALRPIRRREDQLRAVEEAITSDLRAGARRSESETWVRSEGLKAIRQLPEYASYEDICRAVHAVVCAANTAFDHAEKIRVACMRVTLPFGSRGEDREEARDLMGRALRNLELGASDRQFQEAAKNAIAPVVKRIETRNAQEERKRLPRNHQSRIDSKTAYLFFAIFGATAEEKETARRRVRGALERLPTTASDREVDAEIEKQLAPIKAAIQAREQAERVADSALSSVEKYLRDEFDYSPLMTLTTSRGN
jgi:hypothetical protein